MGLLPVLSHALLTIAAIHAATIRIAVALCLPRLHTPALAFRTQPRRLVKTAQLVALPTQGAAVTLLVLLLQASALVTRVTTRRQLMELTASRQRFNLALVFTALSSILISLA